MAKIPIDLIDVYGPDREDDPAELKALEESIRVHRLMNPLVVCPNRNAAPEARGRYVLLAGRRRLKCCKELRHKKVRCIVIKQDDLMNEMVELTENYHRLELSPGRRDEVMIRYAELTRQLVQRTMDANGTWPPRHEPATTAEERHEQVLREKARAAEKAERAARVLRGPGATTKRGTPRKIKMKEPEVVAALVEQFGVSPRVAQQVLRRAEALTDLQRDMLLRNGVLDERLDRICAVEDPEQRNWICDLIAEGLSYTDAMTQVLEDKFVTEERDLSDDEWLSTLPISSGDVNELVFRADALFYRKIAKFKQFFMNSIEWKTLEEEIDGTLGEGGLYYRRLKFFLNCPHPRDWKLCPGCHGGFDRGKKHDACRGAGYLLT